MTSLNETTRTFTLRQNAVRFARTLIAKGAAPAETFTVTATEAGVFEVTWDIAAAAVVETPAPVVSEATETPAPEATEAAPAKPAKPAKRAKERKRAENGKAALDALAASGVMPVKPVITSATNLALQKRFDRLAELAEAGDWEGLAAVVIGGVNTYAKLLRQYQARLLAAHAAQVADANDEVAA